MLPQFAKKETWIYFAPTVCNPGWWILLKNDHYCHNNILTSIWSRWSGVGLVGYRGWVTRTSAALPSHSRRCCKQCHSDQCEIVKTYNNTCRGPYQGLGILVMLVGQQFIVCCKTIDLWINGLFAQFFAIQSSSSAPVLLWAGVPLWSPHLRQALLTFLNIVNIIVVIVAHTITTLNLYITTTTLIITIRAQWPGLLA